MPNFFAYMGWALVFLIPTFILVTFVFYPLAGRPADGREHASRGAAQMTGRGRLSS